MNINKVSQSLLSQSPEFVQAEYPLFNKFLEYYYKSQEKTGLGQNILNNFLSYLDIDHLDVKILDGKTTLAHILANELQVGIKLTSGPVLDKPGDLAGLLTNLESRDILFIDEIHRLSPIVEEYLYSAMEDYKIDIMIETGPNARTVQINLNPFTLVGATTRSGLLTAPMRARFGITNRLEYYSTELLSNIVERSADILKINISNDAAIEIAGRSRGTPRISNGLLRRVRDFAQIKGSGSIDMKITQYSLKALNVDKFGLDDMDNKILTTLIDKFKGGPVGITTLATAVSENG